MYCFSSVGSTPEWGCCAVDFECYTSMHCLPDSSDWADENLAEAAGQLGKMVEHPNQCQPRGALYKKLRFET